MSTEEHKKIFLEDLKILCLENYADYCISTIITVVRTKETLEEEEQRLLDLAFTIKSNSSYKEAILDPDKNYEFIDLLYKCLLKYLYIHEYVLNCLSYISKEGFIRMMRNSIIDAPTDIVFKYMLEDTLANSHTYIAILMDRPVTDLNDTMFDQYVIKYTPRVSVNKMYLIKYILKKVSSKSEAIYNTNIYKHLIIEYSLFKLFGNMLFSSSSTGSEQIICNKITKALYNEDPLVTKYIRKIAEILAVDIEYRIPDNSYVLISYEALKYFKIIIKYLDIQCPFSLYKTSALKSGALINDARSMLYISHFGIDALECIPCTTKVLKQTRRIIKTLYKLKVHPARIKRIESWFNSLGTEPRNRCNVDIILKHDQTTDELMKGVL